MAGERILIADDSRENREFIIDYILRPNNFEMLEARDGMEAMQIARAQSPDLILLDLQMPRLDGRGVLEALRRENLNIPVVLMTFHGSEDIAIEVFRLGVRDYVRKPYTPDEMLSAIEASLSEARLRKEKEALTSRLLIANRDLHARIKELNTLNILGRNIAAVLNPAQLQALIVDAALSLTNATSTRLFLTDQSKADQSKPEQDKLALRAIRVVGDKSARVLNDPINSAILNHVMTNGQPVNLGPKECAAQPDLKDTHSALLLMPLTYNNRRIGIVAAEQNISVGRAFTDHDLALLSTLSDYASVGLENARSFADIETRGSQENSAIRQAFERFVAPNVVERILRNPEGLQLGGERRPISVLFADIRGYTAFAEGEDPQRVVGVLNDYLAVAADTILAREGTLDKFQGDAVMALFNAPGNQTDHPRRAIETALALRETVKEINSWRQGGRALTFGVGVAYGEAVIGNIGMPRAMNYTAIGDVVNVAKRLQEMAEPGQVLIEEAMLRQLGDTIKSTMLRAITLKGRKNPVTIYEVNGLR